jgi:biopolymer transport protein ExbD
MAMLFASPDAEEPELLATINTTPLVDVMLVLLIIFLITIPVVTHTVPVKLPSETIHPYKTKPDNINVAIDHNGTIFWNERQVDENELQNRLNRISIQKPQPEVHVRGDQNVRYEYVGKVISIIQHAGISRVGFVTEPPAQH